MMLVKYPRTPHLPWSQGTTDDDKVLKNCTCFQGKEVIITEKMDGENSTLYYDGKTHARSLDSKNHLSLDWLKSFWAERCFTLGENMRICGENLFAQHSILYSDLESYFLGFSVWENNACLSWDDSLTWFKRLNIIPVRELYRGIFSDKAISKLPIAPGTEGYVVRLVSSFELSDFHKSVAKNVRKNHVQTDEHWMAKSIIRNGLKDQKGSI